jgi:hypothetical protein
MLVTKCWFVLALCEKEKKKVEEVNCSGVIRLNVHFAK